ncbi:DnaJ domain-containing protein [Phanerochaete sordida]|uniref:DnaJ domain-containing protein n=1 Tax=Phanerochaete sordida TaxID=48140 RepID=A0A9P3G091_9APHY|nr:DnaJ domain-containing protein [Phanerochaete sordida]
MFSSFSSAVLNSASSYFYLPIDDEKAEDDDWLFQQGSSSKPHMLSWGQDESEHPGINDSSDFSCSSASSSSSSLASEFDNTPPPRPKHPVIEEILSKNDLYEILGVSRKAALDRLALRRAYLSRSKACHPDKFPGNADATEAFQKVNVAYDILSKPASKRCYDADASRTADFSARPYAQAEETFRSVVLGVFTDFLEGDLETVRTLLRAMNDLNPALRLGDEGIDMVLHSLQAIRERALTCRACVLALHTEVVRLVEVQHAFRQLSYFDLRRRFRLTLELTRIAISLPIALEQAIAQAREDRRDEETNAILNRRLRSILRGSARVLARVEKFLE